MAAFELPPVPDPLKERLPDGWPGLDLQDGEGILVIGDPPSHTVTRRLCQKAFSPRAVPAREPAVRAIATEKLDRVYDRGKCEFNYDVAKPFSSEVIAEILGVQDPADRAQFRVWADDSFYITSPGATYEGLLSRGERLAQMYAFVKDMVERRRVEPQDDMTTWLIQAQEDGATLSTSQIITAVAQVVVAGSDTTAAWISTAIYLGLTRFPEELERMRRDPQTIPQVMEEMLRYRPPVRGAMRVTTRETELAGVRIPAGAKVWVSTAAACADESEFPDARTFDHERPNIKQHLAFGRGAHFCLGAILARLEAKVAMEEILRRMPDLRLQEGAEITWEPLLMLQGLHHLPLEWTP
jgi:cytochrome P450